MFIFHGLGTNQDVNRCLATRTVGEMRGGRRRPFFPPIIYASRRSKCASKAKSAQKSLNEKYRLRRKARQKYIRMPRNRPPNAPKSTPKTYSPAAKQTPPKKSPAATKDPHICFRLRRKKVRHGKSVVRLAVPCFRYVVKKRDSRPKGASAQHVTTYFTP